MKFSGKKSVAYSGTVETSQVAEYLEGLVAGLKAGVITLENDGEVVSLQPASVVELSVEGKRKGDEEKLAIELRWRPEQSLEAPSLKISGEPAAEEEEDEEEEEESDDDEEAAAEASDDDDDRKEADKERRRAEKAKKKKK